MKIDLPQAFEDEAERFCERPSSEVAGPTPLPQLPEVPSLPLGILPDAFQSWVQDAADRARFAPDFMAAVAMVSLGSVIGRKAGIKLKRHDDWVEHGNVWGAMVGTPATLKSPAKREGERLLKVLQARADDEHQIASLEAERADLQWALRFDASKKQAAKTLAKNPDAAIDLAGGDKPEAPKARTYWTSNANIASLGVLLADNPQGLLIERDELSSLLISLENEQNADMRGLLLSAWSGREGYRFDRILRGTTVIPRAAVSLIGGIQPGPLTRYVRQAFTGEKADGLLQRFQLIVWPDQTRFEYIDRRPNHEARHQAQLVFDRADALPLLESPLTFRLNDEAQECFQGWLTDFMTQQRAEFQGGPLAAHLGKYPGLLGKLALSLHLADDPDKDQVSLRTIEKALGWLNYLLPHAERVYHAAEHPETQAAELLLARLRRGDLGNLFKARDAYRKNWQGLSDSRAVRQACRLLADYGWILERDDPDAKSGGRPSDPLYILNPRATL
jgi:hypothetical protein